MQTTITNSASGASEHYVNRRSGELLRRYRGTRARRQKVAEQMLEASQYGLMLAKFKKHRLALISFWVLASIYLMAILANFVAPYSPVTRFGDLVYASPTQIHIRDAEGAFHLPFVYGRTSQPDKIGRAHV